MLELCKFCQKLIATIADNPVFTYEWIKDESFRASASSCQLCRLIYEFGEKGHEKEISRQKEEDEREEDADCRCGTSSQQVTVRIWRADGLISWFSLTGMGPLCYTVKFAVWADEGTYSLH